MNTNLGVEFVDFHYKINNNIIRLKIRESKEDNCSNIFYHNSNLIILMYDIINQTNFERIDYYYNKIKEKKGENFKICLVGNKNDLDSKRVIQTKNALLYSQNNNFDIFYEISCVNGYNINNLLEEIVKVLYLQYMKKEFNDNSKNVLNNSLTENENLSYFNENQTGYIDIEYEKDLNKVNKKKKCCDHCNIY